MRISRQAGQPPHPGADTSPDPVDGALVAALPMLAINIPTTAVALAVAAGASCAVAYALGKALGVAIRSDVTELLDRLDVPPPPGLLDWADAPMWDYGAGSQPNWPALAEAAGEAVDVAAWQRHTVEKFGEPPPPATKIRPVSEVKRKAKWAS